MTSPSPLQPNTYYHVYNCGTNRENIFFEERNYRHFLRLYAYHIEPVADTYAYCLLRNHFHLLIKVKEDPKGFQKPLGSRSASQKFSDLFNSYAKAINKAYGRTGSLFQHPFGRIPITNDRQFWSVVAYIHQNPQKHHFVEDFREWTWSSYAALLSERPTHLKRTEVLEWFSGRERYAQLHTQWVSGAESKAFVQDDEE